MIETIKKTVQQLLGPENTPVIEENTSFELDLDFDSAMFVELLMLLEEAIPGLLIDPVLLRKEDFETVGTLANYLLRTLKGAA